VQIFCGKYLKIGYPRPGMRDTFLFDLDGTLVTMELDFIFIRKHIDAIVVNYGYPEELLDAKVSTLETIKSAVTYAQAKGLDWEHLNQEASAYLKKVESEAASRAVPIEGARTILQILKEKKMKIGIITRNNRNVAVQVLKKCDLCQYIDVILARDDVNRVKPHPDHVVKGMQRLNSVPEQTVVLGDHHFEIVAGNRAGCFTVGFLSGSGTRETLKEADLILDSIKDLKAVLPQLEQ